jgi:hypothetical protein
MSPVFCGHDNVADTTLMKDELRCGGSKTMHGKSVQTGDVMCKSQFVPDAQTAEIKSHRQKEMNT